MIQNQWFYIAYSEENPLFTTDKRPLPSPDFRYQSLEEFATNVVKDILAQAINKNISSAFSPYSFAQTVLLLACGKAEMEQSPLIDIARQLDSHTLPKEIDAASVLRDRIPQLEVNHLILTSPDYTVEKAQLVFQRTTTANRLFHLPQAIDCSRELFEKCPPIEEINHKVASATHQMIPHLLTEAASTLSSDLLIVNSLYLNLPWQMPFGQKKATESAPFIDFDHNVTSVMMMEGDVNLWHGNERNWDFLFIPLDSGLSKYSIETDEDPRFDPLKYRVDFFDEATYMMIALPPAGIDRETFYANWHCLTPDAGFYLRSLASNACGECSLKLPKVLSDSLASKLDVHIEEESAQYPNYFTNKGEHCSSIALVQETKLAITELGVTAESATAAATTTRGGPVKKTFVIDRPYYYTIVHRGLLLFAGAITNPEG